MLPLYLSPFLKAIFHSINKLYKKKIEGVYYFLILQFPKIPRAFMFPLLSVLRFSRHPALNRASFYDLLLVLCPPFSYRLKLPRFVFKFLLLSFPSIWTVSPFETRFQSVIARSLSFVQSPPTFQESRSVWGFSTSSLFFERWSSRCKEFEISTVWTLAFDLWAAPFFFFFSFFLLFFSLKPL